MPVGAHTHTHTHTHIHVEYNALAHSHVSNPLFSFCRRKIQRSARGTFSPSTPPPSGPHSLPVSLPDSMIVIISLHALRIWQEHLCNIHMLTNTCTHLTPIHLPPMPSLVSLHVFLKDSLLMLYFIPISPKQYILNLLVMHATWRNCLSKTFNWCIFNLFSIKNTIIISIRQSFNHWLATMEKAQSTYIMVFAF